MPIKMKEYKGEEILELLVEILVSCDAYSKQEFYKNLLTLDPVMALEKLKPELIKMRERDERSKNAPQYYFLDEASWWDFQCALEAIEALYVYFSLLKEHRPVPNLKFPISERVPIMDTTAYLRKWRSQA